MTCFRFAAAVLLLGSAAPVASAQQPAVEMLPPPPKEVGFDQRIGESIPLDVAFLDEEGRTVKLGDYFGKKPVVLSLAYYDCPMLCRLSLFGLAGSLRGISFDVGKEFEVVTVSFDPRETPKLARTKKAELADQYGRAGAKDGWHFLTGSQASIKRLTSAVGFRYVWDAEQKQYAHATGVVVLTPTGTIARYFFGIEYAPKELRLGLVEAASGKLGTVVDRLLLLCYHYDPKVGKYGMVAFNSMRVAGAVTVLCLVAFFVTMKKREKAEKT